MQRKSFPTHLALCGFINPSIMIWGYFSSVPTVLIHLKMVYNSKGNSIVAKNFIVIERNQAFYLPTNWPLFCWVNTVFPCFWVGVVRGISESLRDLGWDQATKWWSLKNKNPSFMRLCWFRFQDPGFLFSKTPHSEKETWETEDWLVVGSHRLTG